MEGGIMNDHHSRVPSYSFFVESEYHLRTVII